MGVNPTNHILEAVMNQVESSGGESETHSRQDSTEESRERNVKRDEICKAMWSDYTKSALQQNVLLVTKISEEIFFITKNTTLVTKYEFRQ